MVAAFTVGAADRSKSASHFMRGNRALVDAALTPVLSPVVDLGGEDLRQEGQVGESVALGDLGEPGGLRPHGRQVQLPGGGPDGGLGGGVGHGRHELASSRVS